MWRKLLGLALLLCLSVKFVNCKRTFLVVGSQTIPYQGEYKVAVSTFGTDVPENFEISIYGLLEDGNRYEKSKNITLQDNELKEIKFDLQDQTPGNYFLKIRNATFEQNVRLNLNTKKFSIFIQTDKTVYKPGDKIQFRVLVLSPDTRPFLTQSIELFITDANLNRIKQYDNVMFRAGVFNDELQLSEQPLLGVWKIHMRVNDQEPEVVKEFEVAEYEAPKFEVTVSTKEKLSLNDEIIVSFSAKYVYGGEVEGTATVTVDFTDDWLGSEEKKVVKHLDKFTRITSFSIKNDLEIDDVSYTRTGLVTVSFIKTITGQEAIGTAKILIHKSLYTIEPYGSDDTAKPGLPYIVKLLVENIDNVPVTDPIEPVLINVTLTLDSSNSNQTSETQRLFPSWQLPKKLKISYQKFVVNGFVDIPINITPNVTSVTLKASYKGATGNFFIGTRSSASNQYIEIKVPIDEIPIDKSTTIEILSNVDVERIDYLIFARHKLLEKGRLEKEKKIKKIKFELKPTFEMLPAADMIAFYVTKFGEIITDRKVLNFERKLANFLDINLSTSEAKPCSYLNISIKSQPVSYVGLMAVDQRAFMEPRNDITEDIIFNELKSYSMEDVFNNDWEENVTFNNYRDFLSTLTVVLTNANKEYRKPLAFSSKPPSGDEQIGPAYSKQFLPSSENSFLQLPPPSQTTMKKNFVDTWFFDHIINFEGNTTLSKRVPTKMTSWFISGFSLDYEHGIGLSKAPSILNVHMPFFIYLDLPFSIKRDEIISIQPVIFNNMKDDYQATVTLLNEKKEFQIIENSSSHDYLTKIINTTAKSGTSVGFKLRASKTGFISIKIVVATVAGDKIEKQLLVKPEGITRYVNEPFLINLKNHISIKKFIDVSVPKNIVPDSVKIEASFIGDLLGPALNNLESLIQLPFGNGEQNMLKFAATTLVLDYLKSVNKLTSEISKKSKIFLETGYQSELKYKLDDGSYSAFGQLDTKGSTWLTAFVARCFNYALKYITIDDDAITQALSFLHSEQEQDGQYPEVGTVFKKEMQGGASNGVALTAYVLITFLENKNYESSFKRAINRATDNIVRNADRIEDAYTMSIASYALYLAGRNSIADFIMQKLDKIANNSVRMRHWDVISNEDYVTSLSIETSGYALLAYLKANRSIDASLVANWLATQRNHFGGFESIQDTIVGLLALTKMAEKISTNNLNVKIDVKYGKSIKTLKIDQSNSLVLQKVELPSNVRKFEIVANGNGFALTQLTYQYNLIELNKFSNYILNATVTSNQTYSLTLKVCVAIKEFSLSNMAVMEISTPSGYIFDTNSLTSLTGSESNLKKTESRNGQTLANIYFDSLKSEQQCFNVNMTKVFEIEHHKPASIVIYDYYTTKKQGEIMYLIH